MELNPVAFESRKKVFLRHMPSFSGFAESEYFNKEERDYGYVTAKAGIGSIQAGEISWAV